MAALVTGNLLRQQLHLRVAAAVVNSSCSFSTSASCCRWHKDVSQRREIAKYGYDDRVKLTGALPRISEDENKRWDTREPYTPANPWAQKRALFGQNDYIDILGQDPDAFRPSEVNYEQPEWLREVSTNATPYQRLLMKKKLLEETDYPTTHPKSWKELNAMLGRLHNKVAKEWDQYRFANYKGITTTDARAGRFKTKHPF